MTLEARPPFHGSGAMVERMRRFDWTGSALGPPSGWSPALRALVDLTLASEQPMALAWGPDLTTIYNDGYGALLGPGHPDALGANLLTVWSEGRDELAPVVERVLAGRSVRVDDVGPAMDRGGPDRKARFAFSCTPVRDVDGTVAGLLCSCLEITDRILFGPLAQALPIQVWTAAADGGIAWGNARVDDYVGDGRVTRGGAGWAAVIHPDDAPSAAAAWAASVATGVVYGAEFRIRRADGAYRWHLVRAVPLHDGDGRVTRWVGTNTDIDDHKSAEQEVAAARDQAEEANLAKSDFLANMSHELRTPLSAIIGYSEMMREEMEDGTDATALVPDMDKVEGNARHLLGLINDVLDLSKVESGKMDVYAEDFDVADTVRDLAATARTLTDKKGNRLELDLAPNLGTMRSDLTKVRQVLLNLLSNAAKFTEGGVVTLSVRRLAGNDGGDAVAFAVADTGIGMTEDQLSKLFQRFSQADASTTRKFGGTGLGLSLTKALADMLDGTVAVDSAEGRGTTFTFTVPAAHVEAPAAAAAPAPAADEDPDRDLILVIDDDADQRELMTRFLRREGFRVRVAANGADGLDMARSLHPRAILLDVMMPGVDGWSVLSEIKGNPELSAIPVVMVTGSEHRTLAESLGASDFMLKPVRWDRFSQVMDRFRKPDGHILLVEDSDEARVNIRAMLMEDGWEVSEAENGREGLKRVLESRPDAVLMDLNMPVMDGFDFLAELRKLPNCSDVPVIVLTARELTREDRSLLRGASQILNKGDVSLGELVERLHHLSGAAPASAPG